MAADPEDGFLQSLYGRVRSNDVIRHGLLVFGATIVLNGGSFVFHALVSRKLGVTAYGVLYAVVSLVLLASFPAGIVNTVIAKFAAEFRALNDPAHVRALIIAVCKVFGAVLLAYVAAGIAFAGWVGEFLRVPSWEVVLAAAAAGLFVFTFALRAIAQGTQDFRGFSSSLLMDGGLKATLGAALATTALGIAGGLIGFFSGTIISGAYTAWRLWRRYGRAARTEFHFDFRRVFSTTAGAAALTASTALLSYGDVIAVKHFFAPHEAGVYAAASLGGKILFFLVAFAPMVLIPKAADSHSRGKNPMPALSGALLMVLILSALGLLAFVFGGTTILRVLVGAEFGAAASLLPWYGLAMSLLAITNVVAAYSIALHRFGFAVPLGLVALAEIAAIAVYHPALHSVVTILVAGNAVALVVVALALAVSRRDSERG